MIRRYGFPFLAVLMAVWLLALPVGAEPVFTQEQTDTFSGLVVTGVPEQDQGCITLGDRVLCPGDIVTAAQAQVLQFCPAGIDPEATARFTYLPVSDDGVGSEAEVVFSLRGRENREPAAEDSAAETYRDLPITGKLKASDPEGETLTYTLVRQPRRGTVELSPDGTFTYTPKRRKVGIDSFTFTAVDPAGKTSREATVTVTILKPCDSGLYTDTAGRDCRFTAEWMKNTGIFTGEQVGGRACFSPEKTVTRGEFVTMLVKALDIPVDENLTYTPYGDDVPQWLRPYLAAAVRSGLVAGMPDRESFICDEPIPAGEAAALLCTGLSLPADTAAEDFLAAALDTAREAGLELTEGLLTREQAAGALYQAAAMAESSRAGRF